MLQLPLAPRLLSRHDDGVHDPTPPSDDDGDESWRDVDIAPRPRPGHRTTANSSANALDANARIAVFAGVMRGALGALGFFGSVTALPIHVATPVLSGVSALMMATGTAAVWRATRDAPRHSWIWRTLLAICLVSTVASITIVVVWGAGAFSPHRTILPPETRPTVGIDLQPPATAR